MSRRLSILATLAIATLIAAILVPASSPLGGARLAALPDGSTTGFPVTNGASMNGTPFYTVFSVQNLGSSPSDVTVTYVNQNGTLAMQQVVEVPGSGNVFVDNSTVGLPDGFLGSAVLSSDGKFQAIANVTSRPGGEGYGSGYAGYQPPLFDPSRNSLGLTDTLTLQNVGQSMANADTYLVDENGNADPGFIARTLEAGQIVTLTGTASLETPITATTLVTYRTTNTYSSRTPAHIANLNVNAGSSDYPAVVPPTSPDMGQGTTLYIPLSVATKAGFSSSCTIQNVGTVDTDVVGVFYDSAGGKPAGQFSVDVPCAGYVRRPGFQGSVVLSADQPLAAFCTQRTTDGQRTGARTETMTYAVRGVAETARKRALVFGAVSSRRSTVWVGLLNAGTKRVKAKVIVRRGSDGKKLFARTVKAKGHATSFLKYKHKAWGTDTYAEVRVRGKGKVVAYLVRLDKQSGDFTYYPGVVIR